MLGLDVTHKVNVDDRIIQTIEKNNNRASKFFADLMRFYSKFHRKLYETNESPLHDCAWNTFCYGQYTVRVA